jgi:hypothetical protein
VLDEFSRLRGVDCDGVLNGLRLASGSKVKLQVTGEDPYQLVLIDCVSGDTLLTLSAGGGDADFLEYAALLSQSSSDALPSQMATHQTVCCSGHLE